jgi:hypothetical protein
MGANNGVLTGYRGSHGASHWKTHSLRLLPGGAGEVSSGGRQMKGAPNVLENQHWGR